MAKRGSAFFGDDGAMLPEQNNGAGYRGNNVDFSQRYAQSEADEYTSQAEQLTRDLERRGIRLGSERDKFVSEMAEQYRGRPAGPAQPKEPEEEKFSSEKFWNDPAELEKAAKQVRPKKL